MPHWIVTWRSRHSTLPSIKILPLKPAFNARRGWWQDSNMQWDASKYDGIDDVRFKRIVAPGDTLRLEITMEKLGSRFGKGRGVASVAGEVACEGLLSFIIPPEGALR